MMLVLIDIMSVKLSDHEGPLLCHLVTCTAVTARVCVLPTALFPDESETGLHVPVDARNLCHCIHNAMQSRSKLRNNC